PAMIMIDPNKEQRLQRSLGPLFNDVRTQRVEYTAHLTSQEATDLAGMTPSARHLDPLDLIGRGLPDRVTVSVLVTSYRPR
ncbi:MAG: hypothetical protein L0H31_13310, partial [Nocardioidaceae bacterium]|nr:hypothetical protein [Nocardioidaceae bacterium]